MSDRSSGSIQGRCYIRQVSYNLNCRPQGPQNTWPPKYATKNQPITCMTKRAKRARKNWKNYEVLGRSAPKIYVCSYVFGKKNIIGRAQGPRLSGGRSGPGPSPGHHNRCRNLLKSSDSYDSSKDICHHFKMYFEFDKAKMSFIMNFNVKYW